MGNVDRMLRASFRDILREFNLGQTGGGFLEWQPLNEGLGSSVVCSLLLRCRGVSSAQYFLLEGQGEEDTAPLTCLVDQPTNGMRAPGPLAKRMDGMVETQDRTPADRERAQPKAQTENIVFVECVFCWRARRDGKYGNGDGNGDDTDGLGVQVSFCAMSCVLCRGRNQAWRQAGKYLGDDLWWPCLMRPPR